ILQLGIPELGSSPVSTVIAEQTDPAWVEMIDGLPALAPSGQLLTAVSDSGPPDTRRLAVDGVAVSPPGMQLRRVRHIHDDSVIATVSLDPTEQQVARLGFDGSMELLSDGPGIHLGTT